MKSLTSVGVFIINCWVSKISEYPLRIILSFKSTARRKNYPKKERIIFQTPFFTSGKMSVAFVITWRFLESQDIDSAVGSCPKETVLEHYLQQSRLAQMLPRHDISWPPKKQTAFRFEKIGWKMCTSNHPQKIKRIHGIRNL